MSEPTSTQHKRVKLVAEIEGVEDSELLLSTISAFLRLLEVGSLRAKLRIEPPDTGPFYDLSFQATAQMVKNMLAYSKTHAGSGQAISVPSTGLLILDLKSIAREPYPVIMTLFNAYHEYLHIQHPTLNEEQIVELGSVPNMLRAVLDELHP